MPGWEHAPASALERGCSGIRRVQAGPRQTDTKDTEAGLVQRRGKGLQRHPGTSTPHCRLPTPSDMQGVSRGVSCKGGSMEDRNSLAIGTAGLSRNATRRLTTVGFGHLQMPL